MSGIDTERPDEAQENGASPDDTSPESRLAQAEGRAEQHRADFLRAIAELENVRKRAAREVESARQYGIERFASSLLPVADTLALANESAAKADAATLAEGQEATLRLLLKAFENAGLAQLDPVGQPFDPAQHEAMVMQPSAERPPHTVLKVIQKGWVLNGRLLRPARVIVSSAPETPDIAPSGS